MAKKMPTEKLKRKDNKQAIFQKKETFKSKHINFFICSIILLARHLKISTW